MKDVISLVLWGNKERYWKFLPITLIMNAAFHSDKEIWLYTHDECKELEFYSILENVAKKCSNLKIISINQTYQNTQLTLWRMKPLWDKEVGYLFCRDIDALPCEDDIRSTLYFCANKKYIIHSMRSHPLHTTPIMAGLCGFECNQLRMILGSINTFDQYLQYGRDKCPYCKNWDWGCDQEILKKFFLETFRLSNRLLDTPLKNSIGAVPINFRLKGITVPNNEYYKQSLREINSEALEISKKYAGKFFGMPIDSSWGYENSKRNNLLHEVLGLKIDMANFFREEIKNIKLFEV